MKTSIIIGLCLTLLKSGIAQNENTSPENITVTATSTPTPTSETPTEQSNSTTTPSPTSETPTEQSNSTITQHPTSSSTTQEPSTEPSTTIESISSTTPEPANKTKLVEKLSDQIRSILKHFHEPDPTGFPGQAILTDPMSAPNTTTDLTLGTGKFYNMTIHGLSNFTVEGVNLLLDEMQVYVMIRVKKIVVKGNLTMETFISTSKGPFNMTLTNVTAEGTVHLKADSSGKLQADKSSSEMQYEGLEVGTNAGSNSLFQSAMNGAGMALLAKLKPLMLNEVDQRLKEEVNKQLETSPKIPAIANRSPVDMAMVEGRKYVRKFYEPFTITNVVRHDSEYLTVNIGPVTINGLSRFARVGNITVQMKEGVVQLIARFVTSKLNGNCQFFYDFGKIGITRNSTAKFAIDHLQFEAKINQSVNLKKRPVLHDLQMEVGKIQVKLDGRGDFDFLVEKAVILIPDMLRNLIIDSIEEPLKNKVQSDILDKINVEQLIEDNLPLMENFIQF